MQLSMQKSQKGRISAVQLEIETSHRRPGARGRKTDRTEQRTGPVGSRQRNAEDFVATPGSPSLGDIQRKKYD
jgi:hypothetical protein